MRRYCPALVLAALIIWSISYAGGPDDSLAPVGGGTVVSTSWTQPNNVGLVWSLASDTTETVIAGFSYCENGVFIAGTNPNGWILRSTDYGSTWAIATNTAGGDVRVTRYLGGGVAIAGDRTSGQVFRSTDYGATWALLTTLTNIWSAADVGGGVALLGGTTKIYRSIDYGANWSDATITGGAYARMAGLVHFGSSVCFAATGDNGQGFRSTDAGSNWTLATDTTEGILRCVEACGPEVGLMGSSNNGLIYRTTDSGVTWAIATDTPCQYVLDIQNTDNIRVLAGGEKPGGGGQLYRSTDAGITWTTVFTDCAVTTLGYTSDNSGVALAGDLNNGKIYRSVNY